MAVVGAALLGAMGLADAAVDVEHDGGLWLARMYTIDPRTRQIGQCSEIRVAAQPRRLEAAHLTRRSSTTVQPAAIHHGAHGWIMCQTLGVVDILIAGQAAEHGLTKQTSQQVTGILAAAALRQHRTREIREADRVIQFSVNKDAGIGGDATSVEFQPQAAVKINPQGTVIRFTRWVFHEPTIMINTTP